MDAQQLSERYAGLADRFRTLWTFYQFLTGIFKHLERGPLPLKYDFQTLHNRLQELVPHLGQPDAFPAQRELDEVERELAELHSRLHKVELEFPPSLLRRFFDHLKRQDERILVALVKFYLLCPTLDDDTVDKLDILFTRLAETPMEDRRMLRRDRQELWGTFSRLAGSNGPSNLDGVEVSTLVQAIGEFREQVQGLSTFEELLTSPVFDGFRDFKHRLGVTILHPQILVEVVGANIAAKNRFQELYEVEEVRILEDTNRILEIERYLERNPDLANARLRDQIDTFREARSRFDSGRKEDNLKREALLELRRTMYEILEQFEPLRATGTAPTPAAPRASEPGAARQAAAAASPSPAQAAAPAAAQAPAATATASLPSPPPATAPEAEEEPADLLWAEEPAPQASPAATGEEPPKVVEYSGESADIEPLHPETAVPASDLLPADHLLNESLHKIISTLELAGWDLGDGQAVHDGKVKNLNLEPWEAEAYFKLARQQLPAGSLPWELQRFLLVAAALRVKMEEELELIDELNQRNNAEHLMEAMERATHSLERAREVESRFRWFIEDMLYRSDTTQLEQVARSRFRLLRVYSQLWLEHQQRGGLTPL